MAQPPAPAGVTQDQSQNQEAIVRAFMDRVNVAITPTYPDMSNSIIAASPEAILATQADVIDRIKDHCALSPGDFERLIRPVFIRYAQWVHLIPASEMHHHCTPGGLLRHGLEVAMHAARTAEGQYVGLDLNPRERMNYMQRWKVATLVAGLLHDIGKPLVDLTCVNLDGTLTWAPQAESLSQWLTRHNLTHYAYFWRNAGNRHQRHKSVATSVAREIIGPELLAWFAENNSAEVMNLLLITLADTGESSNTMAHIVHTSDSTSVDMDLAEQAKWASRNNAGQQRSIAALVLSALRKRVESGKWKINSEGPLYMTEEGLFGVFPAVMEAASEDLRESGHRAFPNDKHDLAGYLADYHYIQSPTDEDGNSAGHTWLMALTPPSNNPLRFNATVPLKVLRFTRSELIVGHLPLPPPIEAKITTHYDDDKKRKAAASQVEVVGDTDVAVVAQPPVSTVAVTVAVTEASATESEIGTEEIIVIEDRRESVDAATQRQRDIQAANESGKTPEQWGEYLSKSMCGFALKTLYESTVAGTLKLGHDIMVGDDFIGIRFPDAFEAVSMSSNSLMTQLQNEGWVRGIAGVERKVLKLTFPNGRQQNAIQLINGAYEAGISILNAAPAPTSTLEEVVSKAKALPTNTEAPLENTVVTIIEDEPITLPKTPAAPVKAKAAVAPTQAAPVKAKAIVAPTSSKKPPLKKDGESGQLVFADSGELAMERDQRFLTHGPNSPSDMTITNFRKQCSPARIAMTRSYTWLHLAIHARKHGLAHVQDLDPAEVRRLLLQYMKLWTIEPFAMFSMLVLFDHDKNALCIPTEDKNRLVGIKEYAGFKVRQAFVPLPWAIEHFEKGTV